MILLSWVRFIPWYDIWDIMKYAACGAGNTYPSVAPDFTSSFHRRSCCPVICVSLFHVISFIFDFEFWLFLLFDCFVSIFFTLLHRSNNNYMTSKTSVHINPIWFKLRRILLTRSVNNSISKYYYDNFVKYVDNLFTQRHINTS